MKTQKPKYTIKEIFKDHWPIFLISVHTHIRYSILHEVGRLLKCKEPGSGFSTYACMHCQSLLFVPFTCKSRFCNSCGALYSANRAKSIKSKLLPVNHRHIVFTIPEELRAYFLNDRKLLNELFHASAQTMLSWFSEQSNSKHFTPGIVSVLHTFGRDLKWNPHVHMIVTEGAFATDLSWKAFPFIPFEMLRKKWMFFLLKALESHINTSEFGVLKSSLYQKYPNGFYVNAAKKSKSFKNSNAKALIDYIVRYIGRPVMAQSRILEYDKTHVTFWYQPHGATEKITEKIPALQFIKRLIRHIPEQNFKMLRYYGFYSPANKLATPLNKKRLKPKIYNWRHNIIHAFSYDPLLCPKCGSTMELIYIQHPKKPFDKNLKYIYYDDG